MSRRRRTPRQAKEPAKPSRARKALNIALPALLIAALGIVVCLVCFSNKSAATPTVAAHALNPPRGTRKAESLADLRKLSPEQLADEGIAEAAALSVGCEADLIRTLEQTPLPGWKARTDALAQLLEAKTQHVHLASGTLKIEQDVKDWLAGAEEDLLAKLKDGPVVIS